LAIYWQPQLHRLHVLAKKHQWTPTMMPLLTNAVTAATAAAAAVFVSAASSVAIAACKFCMQM
jgi:hypothetical protein